MENLYLSKAIGEPLKQCLAEVADKKPRDPIEWIAHWLYCYADGEIYFYQKSLLLKQTYQAHLELEKEKEMRQQRLKELNAQIAGMRLEIGETKQTFDQMLHALASKAGFRSLTGEAMRWATAGPGGRDWRSGRRGYAGKAGADGWQDGPGGRGLTGRRQGARGDKRQQDGGDTYRGDVPGHLLGSSSWRLDCHLGLICKHSVLGEMRARPAIICPETPEWWDRQGYVQQALYDHEIFSRDPDDEFPGWDRIRHLTYKDFVEEGPWLQEAALRGMHPSLQELYRQSR